MNQDQRDPVSVAIDCALAERREIKLLCAHLVECWEQMGVYGFMCKAPARVPELLADLKRLAEMVR